jgi:cytochrome P450
MAYLVHDHELLVRIQLEVLPAVRGDSIDEKYLLERCPQLEALVNETLRLTVTSSLARVVTETCVVGGKTLQKGNKIMVSCLVPPLFYSLIYSSQLPIRELHYEQGTWGPTPNTLSANRFMDNPRLSKSPSYRPWGGGHTLCPGRNLARRSVNAFLAIILSRFDVALESGTFPQNDGARPSPGVVPVAQGQDLQLLLTPRH